MLVLALMPGEKLVPFTLLSRLIPPPISNGASDMLLVSSMANKSFTIKIKFASDVIVCNYMFVLSFKFLQMKFMCVCIDQPILS